MESYSENKGEGSGHFKALEQGISLEGSLGRSFLDEPCPVVASTPQG